MQNSVKNDVAVLLDNYSGLLRACQVRKFIALVRVMIFENITHLSTRSVVPAFSLTRKMWAELSLPPGFFAAERRSKALL